MLCASVVLDSPLASHNSTCVSSALLLVRLRTMPSNKRINGIPVGGYDTQKVVEMAVLHVYSILGTYKPPRLGHYTYIA